MDLNFVSLISKGFQLQAERNNCEIRNLRMILNWDVVESALKYTLAKVTRGDDDKIIGTEVVGELNFTRDILGVPYDPPCTDLIVNQLASMIINKFCQELQVTDAALIPKIKIMIWFTANDMLALTKEEEQESGKQNQLMGYLKYDGKDIRAIDLLSEFTIG